MRHLKEFVKHEIEKYTENYDTLDWIEYNILIDDDNCILIDGKFARHYFNKQCECKRQGQWNFQLKFKSNKWKFIKFEKE